MATTKLRGTLNATEGLQVGGVPVNAGGSILTKQAAQADSTATDVTGLTADFNALLAKLRLAGVIA